MKVLLSEVAQRLGGVPSHFDGDPVVTSWALDSREATDGSLFLAIRGDKADGHDFISQAIKNGAVAAVAEKEVPFPSILVRDLVSALARMGRSWREEFSGPVIGVTGSAGKTTTKEFIAKALEPLGVVLKTLGNRNTEYTSPLVWSELNANHKTAVIEMGMRGTGHIAHLASISKPTIAVVTNIGYSHLEMVGSREGIARTKAEIFGTVPDDGASVLWAEDDYFDYLKSKSKGRIASFGFSTNADCFIEKYQVMSTERSLVSGKCFGMEWNCQLPYVGRQNALAASCAILVGQLCGVQPPQAAASIESVKLPALRTEWVTLPCGAKALVDAYNASPSSMAFALETLLSVPRTGRAFAALGAMRELGDEEEFAHKRLGDSLVQAGLSGAILLGGPMQHAVDAAQGLPVQLASNLDDVRAYLSNLQEGDVVLIKGSRAYELERALPDGSQPINGGQVHG